MSWDLQISVIDAKVLKYTDTLVIHLCNLGDTTMSDGTPFRRVQSTDLKKGLQARQLVGLEPITIKERDCLRCDRKFTSFNKSNRMCEECRHHGLEYEPHPTWWVE